MHADEDAAPIDQDSHPLRMSGRGAFYSFSFDLGPDLDIVKVANRLLKSDMATVGGSLSREGFRVGKRVTKAYKTHRKYERWTEFVAAAYGDNPTPLNLWKIDKWNTFTLVLWPGRRLILRRLIMRILFGIRYSSANLRAKSSPIPDDLKASLDEIQAALEQMESQFTDQIIMGGVRVRLEQELYFPHFFLGVESFLRLELNHAYFTDGDYETEPIETSLMIHRSGVCILTFATPIAKSVDIKTAHSVSLADSRYFREVKFSEPILTKPLVESMAQNFICIPEDEVHENLLWLTVLARPESERPRMSLTDIFFVYLLAIQNVTRRQLQHEWRCYTTMFLGQPLCGCTENEAKRVHAVDFGQLLVRSQSKFPIESELREDLMENRLVTTHAELWVSGGCAIHTNWKSTEMDYLADMAVIAPIEFAILQHTQLQAIDVRTVNVTEKDQDLFDTQIQLAASMSEYGRTPMADIDAPRIVDAVSDRLNTPQIYTRLHERMKIAESIVNTRFSRRQTRRALTISTLGFAIVVLLLLPRIVEFVATAQKNQTLSEPIRLIVEFLGGYDNAVIWIYALSVLLLLLIVAAFSFRPRLYRRKARTFGFATERDVTIIRDQAAPGATTD